MSSGIPRNVNIYRWIELKLVASPKLFDPPHGVAFLLECLDHRIGAGEVARADGDHDCAGLRHPLLDPLAPIGVALANQRVAKLRGGRQILVKGPRDALDVAA